MPEFLIAKTSDLKDGEMKEVAFESGKALLSRIDGEFYATSHLCPHYKAPMVKGTLSSDGRVMCPWHAACFRVQTGDIEDGPALDGLASFAVSVRGSDVYIQVTEAELKVGKKVPVCVKRVGKGSVVIVGGGASGLVAAETLRKEGYAGKIQMISRETYLPIDRIKLSKTLKIDPVKIALRTKEELDSLDIDILLGKEVKTVDVEAKSVSLTDGTSISYSSLILATGGDPRIIPVDGHKLDNIFVVRGALDTQALDKAMQAFGDKKPNVVVVGSSFIGMESAACLAKLANVTVVGMEKVPFERVLGGQIGTALKKLHEINGIKFKLEAFLDHYEPSKTNSKTVGTVVLKSGEKLPADIVIIGAGVFPQTNYLKGSKIPLDKDGGVSVDEYLRVANVQDVYAVGDIARYPFALVGENVRIEHWDVAQNQGRAAAINIVKKLSEQPLQAFKTIPFFWTMFFGKSIRYAGHAFSYDDVIVQGSIDVDDKGDGLNFIAFYAKQGKVLAACSVGRDPAMSHASELFRVGKFPTAAELKKGKDILSVPLQSSEKFVVPIKPTSASPFKHVLVPALVALASLGIYWYSRSHKA